MTAAPLPPDTEPLLRAGLAQLRLDAAALAPPLLAYLALLTRWNATYNLTAIRDPREMVGKHLLDSLTMAPFVPDAPLADLGTGPGLPGIPLAIARPGCAVTLVESNGKKARFLREAVRMLKLPNARVAESRAEHLAEAGQYTAITARALATLDKIIEFGGHLLAPDGRLLAMKAETVAGEATRLPAGWRLEAVHDLNVPGLAATRQLAEVRRAPRA
ncbi:16S rRNA (guanine(527)-N(7))-methyltransferase RsmG [Lysobacter pythonis]|uniref:Ribosomal RNA small subunit methyltransferase G n=1 Tax=Solilutibacter pythonis TaxID=2483112 RepID=A0A3M2HXE3_9GAMM|nr:16S rRNA (guanine(527)-N(7))-methyltransferase RsmG [Lysobacter pythonis]RMH93738.1 16S rRNA (guanine(527)-N(7))-methyltransferase RsmG [Lysobacter pythonis]